MASNAIQMIADQLTEWDIFAVTVTHDPYEAFGHVMAHVTGTSRALNLTHSAAANIIELHANVLYAAHTGAFLASPCFPRTWKGRRK